MLDEPPEQWSLRLGWSQFRRRHQAGAQRSHEARRAHTSPPHRGTGIIAPHTERLLYCTDAHWTQIAPLLPPLGHYRGAAATPHRLVLEGLLWLVRSGAPWAAVPPGFGTAKTLNHRYRQWSDAGIWPQILAILGRLALPPP